MYNGVDLYKTDILKKKKFKQNDNEIYKTHLTHYTFQVILQLYFGDKKRMTTLS